MVVSHAESMSDVEDRHNEEERSQNATRIPLTDQKRLYRATFTVTQTLIMAVSGDMTFLWMEQKAF